MVDCCKIGKMVLVEKYAKIGVKVNDKACLLVIEVWLFNFKNNSKSYIIRFTYFSGFYI